MSKVVAKLYEDGQLSKEAVERIGRNVAAFARAMNDDSNLEKEANNFSKYVNWEATAGLTLATVGAHALQSVGREAFQGIKNSITKSRDYKAMMDANPHLAEHDAKVVQRAFSTLHKFNPEYASDPMVAGTFVKNTIDAARMDMNMLNNVVQSRKNLSEAYAKEQGPDLSRAIVQRDPLEEARHHAGEQRAIAEHGWKDEARSLDLYPRTLKAMQAGASIPGFQLGSRVNIPDNMHQVVQKKP